MLIAFRDYVRDATFATIGSTNFITPITNLADRRLAVKAITDSTLGSNAFVNFRATFPDPVTMRFVAFLAHNMVANFTNLEIVGYDVSNNVVFSKSIISDYWPPPVNTQFPRNLYIDLEQDYANVSYIVVLYIGETLDPAYQWSCGRLWAGPIWQPTFKTARRSFKMLTLDDSVLNKSIGQQAYADYRPRYRQLTCTLPYLSEAEAIGDSTDDTLPNLQDIGFECGRAGEVIVIPSQATSQVVHKFGVYGHFLEPPPVELIEGARSRKYQTTFDVVEDL